MKNREIIEQFAQAHDEQFFSSTQVSIILNISKSAIKRFRTEQDALPHFHYGKKFFFKKKDLVKWLERHKIAG